MNNCTRTKALTHAYKRTANAFLSGRGFFNYRRCTSCVATPLIKTAPNTYTNTHAHNLLWLFFFLLLDDQFAHTRDTANCNHSIELYLCTRTHIRTLTDRFAHAHTRFYGTLFCLRFAASLLLTLTLLHGFYLHAQQRMLQWLIGSRFWHCNPTHSARRSPKKKSRV